MRYLLFVLLLCPSLAFAQEAWVDDVDVIDEATTPEVGFIDSDLSRFERLEDWQTKTNKTLLDVTDSLTNIAATLKTLTEKPVASAIPGQCECDCDCPSIDEIRGVIREELDRVTVTLKNEKGETKEVELSLTVPGKPAVKSLGVPADGNWYTTAIDGEPCVPTYSHSGRQYYESESYDVGMMPSGGEWVGAARNKKCRMETLQDGRRVKVCN